MKSLPKSHRIQSKKVLPSEDYAENHLLMLNIREHTGAREVRRFANSAKNPPTAQRMTYFNAKRNIAIKERELFTLNRGDALDLDIASL
jgi:hypothetical protein